MKTWIQKSNLPDPRPARRRRTATRADGLVLVFALALWLFAFPVTAAAQGWYWGSPVAPGYDRAAVVEVSGLVLYVDTFQRGGGSTVRIETGGEVFTVTLAPGWYLRQQRADFQVGDKLMVKGSKMKTREGKIYLTAASIKNMRTSRVLELRDENGRPLWSSGRPSDKEGSSEGKP